MNTPCKHPHPLSREQRMQRHLRVYKHFADIAASAARSMAHAERCKLPGWGGHWSHFAAIQQDAAAKSRDCRKRYVKLKAFNL